MKINTDKTFRTVILVGSASILAIFFFFEYLLSTNILSCGDDPHARCYFFLQHVSAFGLSVLPIVVFSCLTYFMRDDVFQTWYKFIYVYIPFSFLNVIFSSSHDGGFIFPSSLSLGTIGLVMLFSFASLLLIAKRKNEE